MLDSIVTIPYSNLSQTEQLNPKIARAFGDKGLGAIVVTDIPEELTQLRDKIYSLGYQLGKLPKDTLEKLSDPKSFYSFGWSEGKEMLEGKPDFKKGSFYANPLHDTPTKNMELIEKYPSFLRSNIWPRKELPDFEITFKQLGQRLIEVALEILKGCDAYVLSQNVAYPPNRLFDLVSQTTPCKGRLLHYYPLTEKQNISNPIKLSNWCGWHNDHGLMTALLPAAYVNDKGNEISYQGNSGLYIQDKSGGCSHVYPPKNSIIYQIGETGQILTGNVLQATPHCVYGMEEEGLTRLSFATFMDIPYDAKMTLPNGTTRTEVVNAFSLNNLPKGVPHLSTRWNEDQTYAEFSEATFKAYY